MNRLIRISFEILKENAAYAHSFTLLYRVEAGTKGKFMRLRIG